MSAFDKMRVVHKLEELGWTNIGEGYDMKPPQGFFDNMPETFYVYDAEVLQDFVEEKAN